MNALIFSILIFVAVVVVAVVAVFFVRSRRASAALKVDRSLKLKSVVDAKQPHASGPKTNAGEATRALPRNRINVLGFSAAIVLIALAVRAWSLQILGGLGYSSQAESNMTATASVAARRGRILDRNGNELATNRESRTVMADSEVADDRKVVHRLSLVLGIPKEAIRTRLLDETSGAQGDRVVASDVSMRAVSFIEENPEIFPGVSVTARTIRTYPNGSVGAHLLGYTGTISEDELKEQGDGISYESGDVVGKTGVEASFEQVLQGTKGEKTYRVDSSGNTLGVVDEIDPDPGNDVKLTIDLNVQRVAETALADGLASARGRGYFNATCGAIVAMDVKTGGILAMASCPTYDPNSFTGGISADLWDSLNNEESGYPMTNRAIAGQYPAASTYKAFTGMAGLTYDLVDNSTAFNCLGTWTGFGSDYPKDCWDLSGHGYLNIYEAIAYSCDVYFYEIAAAFWRIREENPDAMSKYLESWGFGHLTGIDIDGEKAGRVPDSEWKAEYYWETPEEAQWVPGDLANMSIGQGDILVTPLQMCVNYAGVATGKLLKPHVLYEVLNKDGQTVISEKTESSDFAPEMSEENLQIIRDGLRMAVTEGGVSSVFRGFGADMAAKSGTGETGSSERDDYAWFCAYGPVDDPQYCCACVMEQGGGGTASAGPPVRTVMAQLFGFDEEGTVSVDETGER